MYEQIAQLMEKSWTHVDARSARTAWLFQMAEALEEAGLDELADHARQAATDLVNEAIGNAAGAGATW